MKLPKDAIIAPEKLTKYLLVWQPEEDKSKFLARAGYTLDNWQTLEAHIREEILPKEAVFKKHTQYGDRYAIRGTLSGTNETPLRVVTIWQIDAQTSAVRFITLYPDKEADYEI